MTDIQNMFDHIVEDPFYSERYDGMVRVDDHSRVWVDNRHVTTLRTEYDDDIVRELYGDWKRANSFNEINSTNWFTNPRKFHQ